MKIFCPRCLRQKKRRYLVQMMAHNRAICTNCQTFYTDDLLQELIDDTLERESFEESIEREIEIAEALKGGDDDIGPNANTK